MIHGPSVKDYLTSDEWQASNEGYSGSAVSLQNVNAVVGEVRPRTIANIAHRSNRLGPRSPARMISIYWFKDST